MNKGREPEWVQQRLTDTDIWENSKGWARKMDQKSWVSLQKNWEFCQSATSFPCGAPRSRAVTRSDDDIQCFSILSVRVVARRHANALAQFEHDMSWLRIYFDPWEQKHTFNGPPPRSGGHGGNAPSGFRFLAASKLCTARIPAERPWACTVESVQLKRIAVARMCSKALAQGFV